MGIVIVKLSYRESGYATHQPYIIAVCDKIHNGKIIEYGCGNFSTPLLHEICERNSNQLLSVDHDSAYMEPVLKLETEWHRFVRLVDYTELLFDFDFTCNLAFIDSGFWGSRLMIVNEYKRLNSFDYLILHDSDYILNKLPALFKEYPHKQYGVLKPPTTVVRQVSQKRLNINIDLGMEVY